MTLGAGTTFSAPEGLDAVADRPPPSVRTWKGPNVSVDTFVRPLAAVDRDQLMRELLDWRIAGRNMVAGAGDGLVNGLSQTYDAQCSYTGTPLDEDLRRMAVRVQVDVTCATKPKAFALRTVIVQVLTKSDQVTIRIDAQPAGYTQAEAIIAQLWRSLRVAEAQRVAPVAGTCSEFVDATPEGFISLPNGLLIPVPEGFKPVAQLGDATGPSRHGGVYAAVDDEIGDAGRDSILAELDPEGIAQDPYRMGDEDWAKLRKLYSDVMTIRGARLDRIETTSIGGCPAIVMTAHAVVKGKRPPRDWMAIHIFDGSTRVIELDCASVPLLTKVVQSQCIQVAAKFKLLRRRAATAHALYEKPPSAAKAQASAATSAELAALSDSDQKRYRDVSEQGSRGEWAGAYRVAADLAARYGESYPIQAQACEIAMRLGRPYVELQKYCDRMTRLAAHRSGE